MTFLAAREMFAGISMGRPRSQVAVELARAPGGRGAVAIDGLDRKIIEAMQANGRESFREVARRIGVAEGTVRQRFARLQEAGALQVVGITNPLALGFEAIAMIGMRTTGSSDVAAELVAELPEATYVVEVTGQYDVLVELVCSDRHHLHETLGRLRRIEGVASTETFYYLDLVKQNYDWGVRRSPPQRSRTRRP